MVKRKVFANFVANKVLEDAIMGTLSITDIYMNALSSLSDEEKLDLISKLTSSMMHKHRRKASADCMKVFDSFHKDWGGDKAPEDIAEELRGSRVFSRKVPEW